MKKRIILSVTGAFLVSCAIVTGRADTPPAPTPGTPTTLPTTQPLPSAQEVIDRYIDVTGGKEAYASLKSRHLEADYVIADLGMRGKMTAFIRADGKAKFTVNLPNFGDVTQGMNDGVIWANDQTNGPRILSGKEADAVRSSLTLSPEISLKEYESATVTHLVELNGTPAYKMVLRNAVIDANETRYYDVKSGLLLRTDNVMPFQGGQIEMTTRFSDYEDAMPIRVAMKMRQSTVGISPEQQTTKVEHNVEIADEVFALPPEIVELQKHLATTQPKP